MEEMFYSLIVNNINIFFLNFINFSDFHFPINSALVFHICEKNHNQAQLK